MPNKQLPEKWLDNSRICGIETCPRRYYLRHVKDLTTSLMKSKATIYGSAIHFGLAEYFKIIKEAGSFDKPILQDALITATRNTTEWWEQNDVQELDPDNPLGSILKPDWRDSAAATEALAFAIGSMQPKFPLWKSIIAVEQPIIVPIDDDYQFVFRADLVVDRLGSGICIMDHKTTSWPIASTVLKYEGDPQLPSYVMAWNRAYPDQEALVAEYNFIYSVKRRNKAGDFGRLSLGQDAFSMPLGNMSDVRMLERARRAADVIERNKRHNDWPLSQTHCPTRYGLCSYYPLCQTYGYAHAEEVAERALDMGYVEKPWNPLEV